MSREEVRDLVARWQDAVNRRLVEEFADLYTEQAEIESPMIGAALGRDGVVKAFRTFFTAFPDAIFSWEPPIIDGHRVSATAMLSGTDSGGFLGLAPSGKTFRIPIVFLLEIEDSAIVRDRRVYDFTGLLIQIGVLKAKPA